MTDPAASAAVIVLITVPDTACAERISAALVEERLAACVSRLGPLESRFRWEGALERAQELLLIAKTTRERFAALAARVKALHPYDVPEILALPVVEGFAPYLAWVTRETAP